MADQKSDPSMPLQGEGDYIAAKRFQTEETRFAKEGPVEQKAREAADALDGPEAEELEAARKASAEGKSLEH